MDSTPYHIALERKIRDLEGEIMRLRRGAREQKEPWSLIEAMADGITITDLAGKIRYANGAVAEQLGYGRNELTGKSIGVFVSEGDRSRFLFQLKRMLSGKLLPKSFEYLARHKSGRKIPVSITFSYLHDPNGEPKEIIAASRDISKRRKVEEALRESEATARALLNAPDEIMVLLDPDGTILEANDKMERSFHRRKDDLVDTWVWDLFPPELAELRKSNTEKCLRTKKPVRFEDQRKGKWFDSIIYPIFDREGTITKIAVLARDITERKRAEEELRKSEADLKVQTENLEEANAALRVLLRQRDEDRSDLEEKVLSNVKGLILPYVEKLKRTASDDRQQVLLEIIETNLHDIISPFSHRLASKFFDLTPREIQVAALIKDGRTTKDISELLNSTPRTISFHRENLRMKLGLKNKKANLRSRLLALL